MKYLFFLLLFLVIPFSSALTLTETSLNESIYVNGSVSLNQLIVNSTQVALFNLSSEGNFTNIASGTQTIYFYDLTDPFNDIYWDNDTLIEEDADNTSIDIPSSRRIYISGAGVDSTPPTITIINPKIGEDEKSNPIEFLIQTDESSTCDINIDNSTNISMTTSDNLNFQYTEALENGLHEAIFYCNDTLDNQANESIDFYVYLRSVDDGGGVDIIPDEKIFLENISIRYDTWYKNQENSLYVYSYNSTGDFTDLTNISMFSIPEAEKQITRLGEGVYRGTFKVGNYSDITINITAEDQDKIIEELVTIELKNEPLLDKISEKLTPKGKKILRILQSKVFWFSILGVVLLLILYYVYKNHRNSKK